MRVLCKDDKHLGVTVQTIIDDEGEGVILRKVRSVYECGRNSSLVKLKVCGSFHLFLGCIALYAHQLSIH
jgi:hypothetical protein